MKKSIKILLVVLGILLLVATAVFLFWHFGTQSGQIGDSVYYTYVRPTRTVYIHGQGDMWDYWCGRSDGGTFDPAEPTRFGVQRMSPLTYYFADRVRRVVVMDGVTFLSANFLTDSPTLEAVYLSETVERISIEAFPASLSNLKEVHFQGNCPQSHPMLGQDLKNGVILPAGVFGGGHFSDDWGLQEDGSVLSPVIYYQPGTTGWDDPAWDGFQLIEQKYHVNWG